jgi:hypothetical protein
LRTKQKKVTLDFESLHFRLFLPLPPPRLTTAASLRCLADEVGDNGISVLTAADYCQCRLVALIDYYERRSPTLSRRLGLYTMVMIFITALTTGMSLVLRLKLWVPLMVAFGAAIATTLEWEQLQNRHRNVNQCLEELCNLYTWWESLSMVEKRMPINKEHLVLTTETNNDAEISAFVKTGSGRTSSGTSNNDVTTQAESKAAKVDQKKD